MGRGGSITGVQGRDIQAALDSMPADAKSAIKSGALAAFRLVVDHAVALVAVPCAAVVAARLVDMYRTGWLQAYGAALAGSRLEVDLPFFFGLFLAAAALGAAIVAIRRPAGRTYLVDFYCYRPPDRNATTHNEVRAGTRMTGRYTQQSLDFMDKVLDISGLGEDTYLPDGVRAGIERPVEVTMAGARAESEGVLFACVEKLLQRTGLKATDIDALVVNCTAFNPTPSLSAAVVNKFRMRRDVRSFSLHGMGCAASVIAIDLARDILNSHRNTRVLVVGTENILWNLYFGNQRSMLITNCIFRTGGVAFLLSNVPSDARKAKYVLNHVVRTHLGASDEAYNAVIQREDDEGIVGVKIGKELMTVAGKALEANITRLGPLVLPMSEKLLFAANWVFKSGAKPYIPDFTTAFDHFCIHPGGKTVIDGVGKALGLSERQCLPMLVPFERYGNTSSSSTWYAWSFVETEFGVKKGERLWQLGFGSGFKCCSAVWTALRNCDEKHDAWTDTPTLAE